VKSSWAGLIEFGVVIAFVLGWAFLELACLKLDRKKAERERLERENRPNGP
jgi:hypothetical protein